AITLGSNGEASLSDDRVTWLHAAQHGDVVSETIAQTNLPLQKPSRLLRIRQIHDGAVANVLHGAFRNYRDGTLAGRFDADVGEHAQPEFLSGVRHFHAYLRRSGLGIDLWVDVADSAVQHRVGKGLRCDARRRADVDS